MQLNHLICLNSGHSELLVGRCLHVVEYLMLEYQPLFYVVNSNLDTDWTHQATSPALSWSACVCNKCMCANHVFPYFGR